MSQFSASGSTYPGFRADAPLLSDDRLVGGVLLRRVLAWWVDACILAVLAWIAWLALVAFGVLTLGLGLPLISALPVLPLAYNWGFIASAMQATPGQAMLGLTVVRDEDLGPPTIGQALIFTLGFYLTLTIFMPLLIIALFTTRRRALHDLAAGLTLVRSRTLRQVAGGWPA